MQEDPKSEEQITRHESTRERCSSYVVRNFATRWKSGDIEYFRQRATERFKIRAFVI